MDYSLQSSLSGVLPTPAVTLASDRGMQRLVARRLGRTPRSIHFHCGPRGVRRVRVRGVRGVIIRGGMVRRRGVWLGLGVYVWLGLGVYVGL